MPRHPFVPVAIAATLIAAFGVAAAIKRPPPDFSWLPPSAVVRDTAGRPLWVIRIAPAAHEIAVDCLACDPPPPARAYQLWLAPAKSPHSLGLLPVRGRKVTAETPWLFARLSAPAGLLVSLEPARGSDRLAPSGPIVFRAHFQTD